MKKIAVSILAFLYLGLSAGATVQFHYCRGRLVEWKLLTNSPEKCGGCGMKNTVKRGGCCKNELKQIKIEKDQRATELSPGVQPVAFAVLPVVWLEAGNPRGLSLITSKEPFSNHISPGKNVKIYIRNRVFRI
jgi:hypothetical protein